MKLTKNYIRKIIREELNEVAPPDPNAAAAAGGEDAAPAKPAPSILGAGGGLTKANAKLKLSIDHAGIGGLKELAASGEPGAKLGVIEAVLSQIAGVDAAGLKMAKAVLQRLAK